MKVWVVAGGTGGHFYPGLAVAKEFLSTGHTVHFFVRKNDYVLSMLARENIPFTEIYASGFKRSLHPSNLFGPLKLILGFATCFWSVIRFRPEAVIVMGGYLSVPPALAAWLFRVPLILHEQNAMPGLANRFLCLFARKVGVSFPGSEGAFGSKAVLIGNPLRPEFRTHVDRLDALKTFHLVPEKKTILVFGGSLGARAINKAVLDVLKTRKDLAKKFQFLHFTGPKEEESVREMYSQFLFKSHVSGYCHDMATAYAASDFVICRSGASTISELIAVQKPAFLIPYPYATNDHQTKNAAILEKAGAAVVCQEGALLVDRLGAVLDGISGGSQKLEEWTKNFNNLGVQPLESAKTLRLLVESLV